MNARKNKENPGHGHFFSSAVIREINKPVMILMDQ